MFLLFLSVIPEGDLLLSQPSIGLVIPSAAKDLLLFLLFFSVIPEGDLLLSQPSNRQIVYNSFAVRRLRL